LLHDVERTRLRFLAGAKDGERVFDMAQPALNVAQDLQHQLGFGHGIPSPAGWQPASPFSTRRRIASERPTVLARAQSSILAVNSMGTRKAMSGCVAPFPLPGGRPRFRRVTLFDRFMDLIV
jgi:hypothetical protein